MSSSCFGYLVPIGQNSLLIVPDESISAMYSPPDESLKLVFRFPFASGTPDPEA